ncbi:hypothetical protein [Nocardioides piscis]|uniref:ABC transporter permease n=1 Tax=Nocardioides piscis TaxID=2714938 RepID=A0A6G7YHG8_9ACTN|nr:hypothetical protein [Nocardioides piscis]QIK76220.1 hypothetical protein G7071_13055 [Nocardioides piscis]
MIRLLGVELTRLRWRRAVVSLLVAAFAMPLIVLAITLWDSRPVSADELAQAERLAAEQRNDPLFERDLEQCRKDPGSWGAATADDCEALMEPQAEWFLTRQPLEIGPVLRDQGTAIGVVGMMLVLLAGATFVGADWASGSMSNQLLFEPRRLRVWLAKAGALAVAGAVTAAIAQGVFWLGIWLAARSWDIEASAQTWDRVDGVVLRSVALVVGAGVLGFALTTLFRSTVATLGILFAVSVGGMIVLGALGLDARWSPITNLEAWIQDGAEYFSDGEVMCTRDESGNETCEGGGVQTLTWWESARFLGTILAGSVTLSIASFVRRDVP